MVTSVKGGSVASWALDCAAPSRNTFHSCSDAPPCDTLQWPPAILLACSVAASRTRTCTSTSCTCQQMAGTTCNNTYGRCQSVLRNFVLWWNRKKGHILIEHGISCLLVSSLLSAGWSCDHDNEPWGNIQGGKLLDQLREYQLTGNIIHRVVLHMHSCSVTSIQ